MAPFRDYDSDSDSSDDDVVLVTSAVPVASGSSKEPETYTCIHCVKSQTFHSYNELVQHKVRVGHHYCRTCDEDFPDSDAVQLHILNSNKHITCFVCAKEFRSESGLKVHMSQSHRPSASALCPRCHESFSTQSGLLQHVEGNLCPGGLRRSDIHAAITAHQKLTNEHLREEQGSSRDPFTEGDEGNELTDSFSHFKIYDTRDGVVPTAEDDEPIEADEAWYKPNMGLWVCPFKGCKKKYRHKYSFEQHLNSSAHSSKNFSCPGCKRRFPTSSAMLQHIESRMCRIVKTNNYDLVKDSLTTPINEGGSKASSSQRYPSSGIGSANRAVDLLSDFGDKSLSTIG